MPTHSEAPSSPTSSSSTTSLYTTPPHTPLHRRVAIDTILDASSPRVRQLDADLDADSSDHSDDSLFDSEQLSVHTQPTPPTSPPASPPPTQQQSTVVQPPRASFLSRASQTFYAAFKKPITRVVIKHNPTSASAQQTQPRRQTPLTTRPLSKLLDAQISALQSAHAGFVDLSVLVTLTQRTLNAIQTDIQPSLRDHQALRVRCAMLASKAASTSASSDEIADKERILVEAKLFAAEASDSVERLKHQLHVTKRQLAMPQRLKTRTKRHLTAQALVIRETRSAVQQRLEQATAQRASETAALKRAQSEYRAIQGDWA